VKTLVVLGLTRLEAEVYTYLLRHSPATGYGVAKGLGRFKTNVYEALNTLESKGAILVDDGTSRLCRAVPPEEFMSQLERRFHVSRERALSLAEQVDSEEEDERIYRLSALDQVYERCFKMLDASEEVVLIEIDPGPLEMLREGVEKAAERGVRITARIYDPDELKGVKLILSPYLDYSARRAAHAQWLSLCVDGKQYLAALLEPSSKKVHQAFWSANPILSRQYFSLMNSDFLHYAFRSCIESAGSLEELRAEYKKLEEQFPIDRDPGFRDFRNKYGW
jgi:predicted transcriptional regulator